MPAHSQVDAGVGAGIDRASLYPDYLLPIVGDQPDNRNADHFDVLREQLLLAYGYHTARAYRSDLEDWRDWCSYHAQAIDPLCPQPDDVAGFLAERLRDGYSLNTVARRRTTLRLFYDLIDPKDNPARQTNPVRRRQRTPKITER